MRDYTKPHPQAIFQGKPIHYAEVWKSKTGTIEFSDNSIEYLKMDLKVTCFHGHQTIALFIIKRKF